jgi:hypothetical protein
VTLPINIPGARGWPSFQPSPRGVTFAAHRSFQRSPTSVAKRYLRQSTNNSEFGNFVWVAAIYSPELNRVVVGNIDNGNAGWSDDGRFFQNATTSVTASWVGGCWIPDARRFIMVARGGVGNRIQISSDGKVWTGVAAPEANAWRTAAYSPKHRRVVAVSEDGANRVMVSDDYGLTWYSAAAAAAVAWRVVIWIPEHEMFFAVSQTSGTTAMYSYNGINWFTRAIPSGVYNNLMWSPYRGVLCAVSSTGVPIYSYNAGITWRTGNGIPSTMLAIGGCYSPERNEFLVVSDYAGAGATPAAGMTSNDGRIWRECRLERTSTGAGYLTPVWCSKMGLYVVTSYPVGSGMSFCYG